MTKIESSRHTIYFPAEKVFSFLSNFNNFEQIMPEKVTNWTSTKESCYFSISGIASLGMKIMEQKASSYIKIIDDGKVPFAFELIIDIQNTEKPNNSTVQLTFNADLNAMFKMVAVKPLHDFLESLLDHLAKQEL